MDKVMIRKAQQNVRSKRYRDRRRARLAQEKAFANGVSCEQLPEIEPGIVHSVEAIQHESPPAKKTASIFQIYQPEKHIQKSFWAPSLDEKTKYVMRTNNLVVGFVWETDQDGDIYLSGTKVIRAQQRSLRKPSVKRAIYSKEFLQNFTFKVEPTKQVDPAKLSTDDITRNPNENNKFGKAHIASHRNDDADITKVTHTDRILQIKKRLGKKKCLTSTQYALYRYFIARCISCCRSNFTDKRPIANFAIHSKSVTRHSLRVTRSLSSQLSRLRARLKICSQTRRELREQQMLDMIIPTDEEEDSDESSEIHYEQFPVVRMTSSGIRDNWELDSASSQQFLSPHSVGESSESDEVNHSVGRQLGTLSHSVRRPSKRAKLLKVKRQREKLREEQDEWGIADESDDEQLQRTQMRARRYQYLKAAKQAKQHYPGNPSTTNDSMLKSQRRLSKEDRSINIIPSSSTQASNKGVYSGKGAPQIISIESLKNDAVQALSWEVADVSDDADTTGFFTNRDFDTI